MSAQRISLIGLGQAGIAVLGDLLQEAEAQITSIAIDSDRSTLEPCGADHVFAVGGRRAGGLGTGCDPRLGQRFVQERLPEIVEACSGSELVIVLCGLSGGMAGGAAEILDAVRAAGALTICVGILPAEFEEATRREQADGTVASLRAACDAVIAVANDRLFEHTGEEKLKAAFDKGNVLISQSMRALCHLLTRPGYIGLDFADLRRVARVSGLCTISFGDGTGRNRAQSAVKQAAESPLLGKGLALSEAKRVLVAIAGGNGLTLQEVGEVMEAVRGYCSESADVLMGTVIEPHWRSRLAVTLLVAEQGFVWSEPRETAEEDPPVVRDREPEANAERKRRRKGESLQTKLRLDITGKGRFKGVEPTLMDGEDLDIPTFIRRNIKIEK